MNNTVSGRGGNFGLCKSIEVFPLTFGNPRDANFARQISLGINAERRWAFVTSRLGNVQKRC